MAELIQAGNVNKFPKDFRFPELPEAGTVVEFKLLAEASLEITDGRTAVKRYPSMYSFKASSVTVVKDGNKSVTVPISVVTEKNDKDGIERVYKIRFNAQQSNGSFFLTIGKTPEEDMAYTYLFLSSERERANEDELLEYPAAFGVVPTYKIVDKKADAILRREKRAKVAAASDHARAIPDTELREYAVLLGQDDRADIEVMRDAIEMYATAFPNDYLLRVNDEDRKHRALFLKALAGKAIYIDGYDVKWSESDSRMFTMRTDDKDDAADEFVYYVKTNDIAKNMLSLLKQRMDANENGVRKSGRPKKTEE